MSVTIKDNTLNKQEMSQLTTLEAMSEDERAIRMRQEDQARSDRRFIEQYDEYAAMNDHMVSYDCNGKLETQGVVTNDSLITLAKSGIEARAADLVTAGVIPASSIGMPYDHFLSSFDEDGQ